MKEQYIFVSTYCGEGQERLEKNYARLVSIEPSDVGGYILNGAGKLGLLKTVKNGLSKDRKCDEITLKEASITYKNNRDLYHGHAEILNKQFDKVCIIIEVETNGNISVQQAPGEMFGTFLEVAYSTAEMLTLERENENVISYTNYERGSFMRIINLV